MNKLEIYRALEKNKDCAQCLMHRSQSTFDQGDLKKLARTAERAQSDARRAKLRKEVTELKERINDRVRVALRHLEEDHQ